MIDKAILSAEKISLMETIEVPLSELKKIISLNSFSAWFKTLVCALQVPHQTSYELITIVFPEAFAFSKASIEKLVFIKK